MSAPLRRRRPRSAAPRPAAEAARPPAAAAAAAGPPRRRRRRHSAGAAAAAAAPPAAPAPRRQLRQARRAAPPAARPQGAPAAAPAADSDDDGDTDSGSSVSDNAVRIQGQSDDDEDRVPADDGDPVYPWEGQDDEESSETTEDEGEPKTRARQAWERAGEDSSYSSDDEFGPLVRTGDVPLVWYQGEDHAGYDVEGNRIAKETRDALQQLIAKVDSPEEMMTVYEKLTGKAHKLSKEDVQVILNLQNNRYTDPNFDPYPDMLDTVRFAPGKNPFEKGMPPKKRFQPSKHEMRQIAKLVRRLRRFEKYPPPKPPEKDPVFDLWGQEDPALEAAMAKRRQWHIGPPKAALPSTAESYNPPLEYLPTQEELESIQKEEPIDRPEFVPQKFDALRKVPWYRNTLRERYQRCLDLFMFTRKKKQKVNIVPESLLPDLPRPDELRPFPQKLGFIYTGHTAPVRCVAPSPSGQYIVTACDDHFGRVYEVCTGRLVCKWNMKAPVSWCGFSPNPVHNIVAFAHDKIVSFAVPRACATDAVNEASVEFLRSGLTKGGAAQEAMQIVSEMDVGEDDEAPPEDLDKTIEDPDPEGPACRWEDYEGVERRRGLVLKIVHNFRVKNFTWHHKGDYVGTLCPKDQRSRQILLLQLSVRNSFQPFKRMKDQVMSLSFHPTQPYILVVTRVSVRVYNLLQSQLVKKLRGTVDCLSAVDVHPQGDNVLAASYDSQVMWYDLDLSDKPYKKLTSHKHSVQSVRYHPTPTVYPLFASGGDDGQIHVFHGRVYDDLTKNAFIVPLKILKAHKVTEAVGVTHVAFHPSLPWLFSAGGDNLVKCWTE